MRTHVISRLILILTVGFGVRTAWMAWGQAAASEPAAIAASTEADCLITEPGIYIYDGPEFSGKCVWLDADSPNAARWRIGLRSASSIRFVGGEWWVTLFPEVGFAGVPVLISQEARNLADLPLGDNALASIRIRPAQCDDASPVRLYTEPDYGGRCLAVTEEAAELALAGAKVKSFQLADGVVAAVFPGPVFSGAGMTYSASMRNLDAEGRPSMTIESVSVVRPQSCDDQKEGLYLYEQVNFEGRCVRLDGDAGNLSVWPWVNDQASSARVVGPWLVQVYEHAGYVGMAANLAGAVVDLNQTAIGADRLSSARLVRSAACDGQPGVYVFTEPDYQGRCARLTANVSLATLLPIGNDAVQSVRVKGAWEVWFYQDSEYRGARARIAADWPTLENLAVGNLQLSAIAIRPVTTPAAISGWCWWWCR